MLHGKPAYSVTCTYPKGKPLLTIEVPDDMDIDDRFAALREVIGMHKSIITEDRAKRGYAAPKGNLTLSALLRERKS